MDACRARRLNVDRSSLRLPLLRPDFVHLLVPAIFEEDIVLRTRWFLYLLRRSQGLLLLRLSPWSLIGQMLLFFVATAELVDELLQG